MKKYLEVAKVYLKVKLMWRADLIFGFISIVMKIIFASLLWGVIFRDKETVAGFMQNSMMAYYLLSAFFTQIDISEKISGDITLGIRNGTFTKYMAVPMDTDKYFLAMEAGSILPHIVLDVAAIFLIGLVFGIKIDITSDVAIILCALLIAFLGLLFMAQLSYFLGILTFRFEEISTFLMIKHRLHHTIGTPAGNGREMYADPSFLLYSLSAVYAADREKWGGSRWRDVCYAGMESRYLASLKECL